MPSIPWELVRDVVDAVLDLPAEARPSYLDQVCPQPALRRYVESLVHSYEEAGNFLDEPAAVHHIHTLSQPGADSWKGRRIGSYQIIEHVGEGGMGEVYRALRADDQYEKEVAIKLVRAGIDSRFTLGRFKAERQILANLDHPNTRACWTAALPRRANPTLLWNMSEAAPSTNTATSTS
jgi:serine/threonine protein kinase